MNFNPPPVQYRTWFAVWLAMKKLTPNEFARITIVHPCSVKNWMKGKPMGVHYAKWIKAFYPDAPIDSRGGCPVSVKLPLPYQTRSRAMYRFIDRIKDSLEFGANPDVLACAREVNS